MYKNIPENMRKVNRWGLFKIAQGKKIPYSIEGGHLKICGYSQFVSNFDTVFNYVTKHQEFGIGFQTGDGWYFIDIDKREDEIKELKSGLVEDTNISSAIIDFLGETYVEISPSGAGVHIIGYSPQAENLESNKFQGLEIYYSKRYFTVTGDKISLTNNVNNILDKTLKLQEVASKLNSEGNEVLSSNLIDLLKYSDAELEEVIGKKVKIVDNIDYDLHIIEKVIYMLLKNDKAKALFYDQTEEYGSLSEKRIALCNYIAFYSNRDPKLVDIVFKQSEIYLRNVEKWERLGEDLCNKVINECENFYNFEKLAFIADMEKYFLSNKFKNFNDAEYIQHFCEIIKKDVYTEEGNIYFWNYKFFEMFNKEQAKDKIMRLVIIFYETLCKMNKAELIYIKPEEAFDEDLKEKVLKSFEKFINRKSSNAQMNACVNMAFTRVKGMLMDKKEEDSYLLNLKNGVLDLRTFNLLQRDRKMVLRNLADVEYNPKEKSTIFNKYIETLFPDPEMVKEIQKFLGYCLTGDASYQKILYLFGRGGTGKSLLLSVIANVLGSYALNLSKSAFNSKTHAETASPDLMRIQNKRFVYIDEFGGGGIDVDMIKKVTSGDVITARNLHEAPKTFVVRAKFMLVGNNPLRLADNSGGIKRRLISLNPLSVSISKDLIDVNFKFKLLTKRSAILNFMIKGLKLLKKEGFNTELASVKEAVEEIENLANEQDINFIVGNFVAEKIEYKEDTREKAIDVYKAYVGWCKDRGYFAKSINTFGKAFKKVLESSFSWKADKDYKKTDKGNRYTKIIIKNIFE